MLDKIYQLRKEIHQHPELSGVEAETANRLTKFVRQHHDTEIINEIGGNGVAVIYSFPNPGPTILIRSELDALPIEESNSFEHRSVKQGVSHKCGHDGHMAIVAGLIFWIKKAAFNKGKIVLLFQPAEENGQGAFQVINDLKFKNIQPDYVFALHNLPGESLHTIVVTKDVFTPTVQSVAIYLKGKQAHASEPENGINPAGAIAEFINSFNLLNNTNLHDKEFALLTPIHILMGEKAYGISAGYGELHYTLRSWTEEVMENLKNNLNVLTENICQKHQLSFLKEWFDYFPATINDGYCNKLIKNAAEINGFTVIEKAHPFKFGEDMGWFSRKYKVGMFGLGAGLNSPALHHDDYDFPDEIINTGIQMFTTIITQILTKE